MHTCPMCTGTVPHVGGPITGPGTPNILVNEKPAAVMGDSCTCVGPPDMVVQGTANVFFNDAPVVCQGDMTAHGGIVTQGEPNIIISTSSPEPKVTLSIKRIPFPKFTTVNRITGNAKQAMANQEKLKKEAERATDRSQEPRIFNLRWIKEERVIRSEKILKQVFLKADVLHIPEGQPATIKLELPSQESQEKQDAGSGPQREVVELTGTVRNKSVEVVWKTEQGDVTLA